MKTNEAMEQVKLAVIAIGLQALYKATEAAYIKIREGYKNTNEVYDENGVKVSQMSGVEISEKVEYVMEGARGAVFITDRRAAEEAHRRYALGADSDIKRNPFLAAWLMLNSKANMVHITGLEAS